MKQELATKSDDHLDIELISDDKKYEAPKQADVQNFPAVNPKEKQHLRPKGKADDLMCFGKISQPPEVEIDDSTVVVALPKASTVNGCPLEPKKVDGSKVKLQSWVKGILHPKTIICRKLHLDILFEPMLFIFFKNVCTSSGSISGPKM